MSESRQQDPTLAALSIDAGFRQCVLSCKSSGIELSICHCKSADDQVIWKLSKLNHLDVAGGLKLATVTIISYRLASVVFGSKTVTDLVI